MAERLRKLTHRVQRERGGAACPSQADQEGAGQVADEVGDAHGAERRGRAFTDTIGRHTPLVHPDRHEQQRRRDDGGRGYLGGVEIGGEPGAFRQLREPVARSHQRGEGQPRDLSTWDPSKWDPSRWDPSNLDPSTWDPTGESAGSSCVAVPGGTQEKEEGGAEGEKEETRRGKKEVHGRDHEGIMKGS